MLLELTDEEAVAHSDALVKRVAEALAYVRRVHPGAPTDALCRVLYMVNGKDWISASDMARARVMAKALGPETI